jgi:thiol-disulfide isomerase/thioredoxin
MKLSQKDKSLLLFIVAVLIILWGAFTFVSHFFFSATYRSSDIAKLVNSKDKKWFNVSRPLEISDLKERIILLDFWTYDCVNCISAFTEIKKLENQFGSKLTVIGVHSGKFENQKDPAEIKKAILKFDIEHPIINDSDLKIWNQFKVKSWPTFILINPNGNIVKTYIGENELPKVKRDLKKLISKYKFEVNREPMPTLLEKHDMIGNVLNFPTKLEYAADFLYKTRHLPVIFIANTGQHNIIISSLSGEIIAKVGSGKEGFQDGTFDVANFSFPQGLLYDSGKLYVADRGNHAIREINFKEGKVSTLIGSSQRGEVIESGGEFLEAKNVNLSSPVDIEFFPNHENIVIANSGTNQILSYNLKKKTVSILAGNGSEGMDDGKYPENSLAQTADMSASNRKLYFVDSQSSSLRVLDESGNVKTLIGKDLAKFGHENGEKSRALMQHPLGLMVDDTGAYISDSFNHVIRKYDFSSSQIRDFIGGRKHGNGVGTSANTQFNEPEGIIAVLDRFYVSDSNNNRILAIGRGSLNSELLDVMPPLRLPKEGFLQYLPNLQKAEEIDVKSDAEVVIKIDLKKGWKINESGPSFINLLELVDDDKANMVASFDWRTVSTKEIKLPKLKDGKYYMLQGTIYFCEDKKNSLCYIKSYEQRIEADSGEEKSQIEIKLGY